MLINYKKLLISKDRTIIDAIKIIDLTDLRVCFVVDNSRKLIGSITDGDVRRGLIKKISLFENVLKICNKKSIFSKSQIKIYNNINVSCIPIIDNKKKIIDIQVLKKNKFRIAKTVLIMAGGKGTRLLPLTKNLPKPLIKIKGKTLIESLIYKLQKEGFTSINISLHHLSNKIKKFILKQKKIDKKKINFIIENKPLGTAGSISGLKTIDQNFVLVNCDIKLNIDFKTVIDFHLNHKADITVISKRLINKSFYGLINLDKNFNLKSIDEKPLITRYINTGAYIINKSVKKLIKKNTKMDMDQLLRIAIKKKFKIIVYPLYENWVDLGILSKLKRERKKNKDF